MQQSPTAEATRLDALRLDALEEQFEAALALGEHADVGVAIRKALEESPFRERLWGHLMLALYRSGRRRLVASAVVHALAWASGGLEIYIVLRLLGTEVPLLTALIIESFASGVKFASFMVPASLGALEGGYVAFFEAFGLTATGGLTFVLVRRLREMAWAGVGFLALGVSGRPTALTGTDRPPA
jgi:uncharacterized membrane protein YbhN (UPF0104 family)